MLEGGNRKPDTCIQGLRFRVFDLHGRVARSLNMIQLRTLLKVADNSGAKEIRCFHIQHHADVAGGQIGDIVTGSVQKRIPNSSIEKGQIVKGVIVRTRGAYRREDGSYIRFDDNAVVLINEKLEPVGTRIFGPVPRELRHKNMIRILSLAPEVL